MYYRVQGFDTDGNKFVDIEYDNNLRPPRPYCYMTINIVDNGTQTITFDRVQDNTIRSVCQLRRAFPQMNNAQLVDELIEEFDTHFDPDPSSRSYRNRLLILQAIAWTLLYRKYGSLFRLDNLNVDYDSERHPDSDSDITDADS